MFDRGFAGEKLVKYMNYFDSDYIMRVPKNSGIVGEQWNSRSGIQGKAIILWTLGIFQGNVLSH